LNRLDDIIIFRQLTLETMAPIVSIQLKRLQNLMMDREITLDLTDEAIVLLAEKGFNPLYGARPLKRVIQTKLQDILAEKIIEGTIKEKQTVTITAADEELVFQDAGSTGTPLESGQDEASDAESESTVEDSD
jgi:ATP-dependent Clp protease ATP-binding subunit ClpB